MMNMVLAVVIVAAASVLAWFLVKAGHVASPVLLFLVAIWCATGLFNPRTVPMFQSSIQITKQTASEAEKETP